MTKLSPKYNPPAFIRQYVLKLLRVNNLIAPQGPDAYGGRNPMVLLEDEPRLSEYDAPYIVYGYTLDTDRSFPERGTGTMTMVVRSTLKSQLEEILNVLKVAFERQDETAKDVNYFSSTIPDFVGLRFGSFDAALLESPEPPETEGGRNTGALTIQFDYYVDYDVVTNFAS